MGIFNCDLHSGGNCLGIVDCLSANQMALILDLTCNLDEIYCYRANFKFDLKYELTSEFYAVVGYTFNYDSKPVSEASNNDYVFLTSLGWEL